MKKNTIIMALAAVLLVVATAGASVYLTQENAKPDTVETKRVVHTNTVVKSQPAPTNTAAACNDGNIAGKVVGGVGGGVLGSMVGKGKGKTVATIGGTLGGAYMGGDVIPLNNVTCPR